MPSADQPQWKSSFTEEVTSRFGVLPNFFCTAPAADGLVQELWKFAKAGYLDSPLPSLFKERLFVHLSRFCEVRYCIVRHVGFLIGEGRPAGDASVSPQTIEEVLRLLRRPVPGAAEVSAGLSRLESCQPSPEMPQSDTQTERDLFDALTLIFIEPHRSQRARSAVSHAFGERSFEILTAFLAFVRTAHYWTETHPTLPYEPDMLAVMAKEAELARLLLDPSEAEQAKASEALRRTVAELHEMRGERAKAVEALLVSEERLRSVLLTARMAFWEWDPATDQIEASEMMSELFGLLPGQKIPSVRHAFERVHLDDLSVYRAKVEAAIREGGTWHHSFRIHRPRDGKIAWLEEHAYTTTEPHTGKVVVTGLVWAITERKLLESSLQQADRRKDEFLATLAHELRNPLAPLRNGLQIARLTSNADSTLQRTIEMMDRQLTHLVRLVDDLLDVGRINAGKIELRRDAIALSDVLVGSAEAARSTIDAHGHELLIKPGADELWVRGDFDRLTQIFSNLLTNAAKYTDSGGTIELHVERVGDCAVVRVTDNGIGIPADDLPHVFELFSQVRVHQGRAEGGLGIGLSLVHKLVEMHQGTVSVFSEGSGQGSTFTVRLPLISTDARSETRSAAANQPSIAHRRILIVDDNHDAADSLGMLLQHQGHEVVITDAEDGVARARQLKPDLVFLDLGMPGTNGIEAALQLRSLAGGERITLVALTGWGHEQDQQRTREAGFDWHLIKPVDIRDLNKVLGASRR